jgi:hypothetical protein
VSVDPGAARAAALAGARLDADRLEVTDSGRGAAGSIVTVAVAYRSPTRVPLVGTLVPDPILRATAAMRVEG